MVGEGREVVKGVQENQIIGEGEVVRGIQENQVGREGGEVVGGIWENQVIGGGGEMIGGIKEIQLVRGGEKAVNDKEICVEKGNGRTRREKVVTGREMKMKW